MSGRRDWRKPKAGGVNPRERGATWTYLTTDEPFGLLTERIMLGLRRVFAQRR